MGVLNLPLLNDYSLCQQTVSIYHCENNEVTRTVIYPAYLDYKKTENVEKTGSTETNGFLLIIPCTTTAPVAIGDKVMAGEGPVVDSEDQMRWWRTFVPAKHTGLVVVRYVDPKHWNGELCHVEAGG